MNRPTGVRAPEKSSRHAVARTAGLAVGLGIASVLAVPALAMAAPVPLQVPDINPTKPDGFNGLITILNWIAWGVIVACLAGFIFNAGRIGFALRNGGELEGMKGAVLAVIGCVLVGGASGLFNLLTA